VAPQKYLYACFVKSEKYKRAQNGRSIWRVPVMQLYMKEFLLVFFFLPIFVNETVLGKHLIRRFFSLSLGGII
jgi:hypothetical protein